MWIFASDPFGGKSDSWPSHILVVRGRHSVGSFVPTGDLITGKGLHANGAYGSGLAGGGGEISPLFVLHRNVCLMH